MRTLRRNNIPLPNLGLIQKLIFSGLIIAGATVFIATWIHVLHSVYMDDGETIFGVGLGVLANSDFASYRLMFAAHAVSLLVLLAGAYLLFRQTSLRRKMKGLIAATAVFLAALDLFFGQLAVGCRIEACHAASHFPIGDRLDLERMQAGEGRDLIKGQGRVLDQPDGGRLGHEKRVGHEIKSSRSPASLARAVGKPPILGK